MAQATEPGRLTAFSRAARLVQVSVLVSTLLGTELARAQSAPASRRAAPAPVAPSAPAEKSVPAETYWFLGVAAGSFVTAGVLLGSALSSLKEAEGRCDSKCPSERTNIRTTLATADLMGLVGITCSVLALYSYETSVAAPPRSGLAPSKVQAVRSFGLRPVREGAVAELVWRF